jgi:S1-C subfamily serine protease
MLRNLPFLKHTCLGLFRTDSAMCRNLFLLNVVLAFSWTIEAQSWLDDQKSFWDTQQTCEPIEGVYSATILAKQTFMGNIETSTIQNAWMCSIQRDGDKFIGHLDPSVEHVDRFELLPSAAADVFVGTVYYSNYNTGGWNAFMTAAGNIIDFTFTKPREQLCDELNMQSGLSKGQRKRLCAGLKQDFEVTLLQIYPLNSNEEPSAGISGILGSASATVIDAEAGYLVTNEHVVRRGGDVFVRIGSEEIPCSVVSRDADNDLALLKIGDWKNEERLVSLPVAFEVDLGQQVFALGYPKMDELGKSIKVTDGVISAMSFMEKPNMYQISCPITNGNSGGALVTSDGYLVGITQGGYRPDANTENVNGAVKSSAMSALVQSYCALSDKHANSYSINESNRSVLPLVIRTN